MGGQDADLTLSQGAEAVLDIAMTAGSRENGSFKNISVPGWEKYDGHDVPWRVSREALTRNSSFSGHIHRLAYKLGTSPIHVLPWKIIGTYRFLLFILSLAQNVQLVDSVTISVTSMEKRARAFQLSGRVLSLVGILDELFIPNCSILSTFSPSCMRYRAEEQIDLVNGLWDNVNFSSL